MNLGIFGTHTYPKFFAYSEPWNILKFDDIYIPIKIIVMSSENNTRS